MATIHERANAALARATDTSYKSHVEKLWSDKEFAFALLVLWCQIEARLKLIRYYDKIKDGWPDKLTFIRKDWTPLKRIFNENESYYTLVFVGEKSLWKLRDQIAHTACKIDPQKAVPLFDAGEWVLGYLNGVLPQRKALLKKKRNSDAQINRNNKPAQGIK